MSKIMRFEVRIPDIPDWMPVSAVREQLEREITHPYDAAFDASIDVNFEEEIEE